MCVNDTVPARLLSRGPCSKSFLFPGGVAVCVCTKTTNTLFDSSAQGFPGLPRPSRNLLYVPCRAAGRCRLKIICTPYVYVLNSTLACVGAEPSMMALPSGKITRESTLGCALGLHVDPFRGAPFTAGEPYRRTASKVAHTLLY
jgi:hypothetical protein